MVDAVQSVRESVSYRALSLERRVHRALEAAGWRTAHSAHYRDPESGKERELDVDAVRMWRRNSDDGALFVRLHLLVQCKSIKGGRLLFAQAPPRATENGTYIHWLDIQDDGTRARLHDLLVACGLDPAATLRELFAHSYPEPEGLSLISDLLPDAPEPARRASAGREVSTKGGDDRRYLWDASQSLHAAIHGASAELFAASLGEIRDSLVAETEGREAAAIEVLRGEAATVTIFHPIVVTDAALWQLGDDDEPLAITSCRLDQSRIADSLRRWIDVVHESALADHAAETTRWYSDFFARCGATELTPKEG